MNYIGIDIGGTGIKAALTDDSGMVLEAVKTPTPSDNIQDLIAAVCGLVTTFRQKATIGGVGVGIPGLLNTRTRIVETSPNISSARSSRCM